MRPLHVNWRRLVLGVVFCLACACFAAAPEDATLTKEQMKQFLLNAKVVKSRQTGKGITSPWRLTLSDGTVTHDGGFQSVDEHKARMEFANGTVELNFVDSYKYNIAAYALAEFLGVDDMLPVYVERKWNGRSKSYPRRTRMPGTSKCTESGSSTNWSTILIPTSPTSLLARTGGFGGWISAALSESRKT